MTEPSVKTGDAGAWTVEGELTFATVPALERRTLEQFDAPPETLDLAGVERMDSAGIALVVEWARRARGAGGSMRLVNVPAGMTALSKTTGLTRLLNIDDPA